MHATAKRVSITPSSEPNRILPTGEVVGGKATLSANSRACPIATVRISIRTGLIVS